MMNIRDFIFINKAKSPNKIRILDILGFDTNTDITHSPEILKEINDNLITADIESEEILSEQRPNQDTEKLSKILGRKINDIHKFVTKYGIEADDLLDVLDAGSSSQRRRYSMAILAAMKGNRRALRDLDNLLGFL